MFSILHRKILMPLIAASLLAGMPAVAEEVKVPVGSQGSLYQEVQMRGLSMDDIINRLGEPLAKEGPVGEPPISRWEYQEFYVYFEHRTVLHTVMKFRPKTEDQ